MIKDYGDKLTQLLKIKLETVIIDKSHSYDANYCWVYSTRLKIKRNEKHNTRRYSVPLSIDKDGVYINYIYKTSINDEGELMDFDGGMTYYFGKLKIIGVDIV